MLKNIFYIRDIILIIMIQSKVVLPEWICGNGTTPEEKGIISKKRVRSCLSKLLSLPN